MSIDDMSLPPGLYEQLLTEELRRQLPEERSDYAALTDDAYPLLTRHVANGLNRALRGASLSLVEKVELCNRLLNEIQFSGPAGAVVPSDSIPLPAELLTCIQPPTSGLSRSLPLPRPETPLSEDALLVNAPHEPGLATELRTELLSADRVDLISAFIVWSGVRVFLDARGLTVSVPSRKVKSMQFSPLMFLTRV